MWHMPGHIYSKLKRYGDAAWQQEASARVDHAHMIRTRLMPDQIHNFAHNNEWLIRNLLYVGRVEDALDLSRNLVSLPRHPKYNSLEKGGSYKYGRQRLLQTLSEYGLWEELIRQADGPNLLMVNNRAQQDDWLGWLAAAQFITADAERGTQTMQSLWRRQIELEIQWLNLADGRSADEVQDADSNDSDAKPSREELKKEIAQVRRVIARGAAAAAIHRKDVDTLKRHLEVAKIDQVIQAQWLADAGDLNGAIKLAEKATKKGKSQVRPLAVWVNLLWRNGEKEQAKKKFQSLRKVAAGRRHRTPQCWPGLRRLPKRLISKVIGESRPSRPRIWEHVRRWIRTRSVSMAALPDSLVECDFRRVANRSSVKISPADHESSSSIWASAVCTVSNSCMSSRRRSKIFVSRGLSWLRSVAKRLTSCKQASRTSTPRWTFRCCPMRSNRCLRAFELGTTSKISRCTERS